MSASTSGSVFTLGDDVEGVSSRVGGFGHDAGGSKTGPARVGRGGGAVGVGPSTMGRALSKPAARRSRDMSWAGVRMLSNSGRRGMLADRHARHLRCGYSMGRTYVQLMAAHRRTLESWNEGMAEFGGYVLRSDASFRRGTQCTHS